ncbi:MAG TPA: YceI family protein [Allosphingosinicella sp.]|jgi:polyisoprenoid-binding protein YceI
MKILPATALFAALAVCLPAIAQMPGAPDRARVQAGRYTVDPNHTQVLWTVNHLGISPLSGAFGASGGSLQIDPRNLSAAKVSVTFNVAEMSTTSGGFTKHLSSADFFEVAKHPTATFVSTSVQPKGNAATIRGNLTIKGITRPVTLDATFFGAGVNERSKKTNIGFSGTASIKRSEFGLGMAVPVVADRVDLRIHAAFEQAG